MFFDTTYSDPFEQLAECLVVNIMHSIFLKNSFTGCQLHSGCNTQFTFRMSRSVNIDFLLSERCFLVKFAFLTVLLTVRASRFLSRSISPLYMHILGFFKIGHSSLPGKPGKYHPFLGILEIFR